MKKGLKSKRIGTDRERVLVTGHEGTRKSTSIVHLAQMYPNVGIAVIDPDGGLKKVIERHFDGWESIPNLIHFPVVDWQGVEEAYEEIREHLEPGDWLAIDGVHHLWDWSQQAFVLRKHRKTHRDFKLSLFEKGANTGFEGIASEEWNTVKLFYEGVIPDALKRQPWNLYFTSIAREVVTITKDNKKTYRPAVKKEWVDLGVAPTCEKHLPSQVDTCLYVESSSSVAGLKFKYQSVGKDRNFTGKVSGEFDNLWKTYLEAIGQSTDRSPGA